MYEGLRVFEDGAEFLSNRSDRSQFPLVKSRLDPAKKLAVEDDFVRRENQLENLLALAVDIFGVNEMFVGHDERMVRRQFHTQSAGLRLQRPAFRWFCVHSGAPGHD